MSRLPNTGIRAASCAAFKVSGLLSPLLHVVAQQVLAYRVAKGTDVDKRRNLAKSVTT